MAEQVYFFSTALTSGNFDLMIGFAHADTGGGGGVAARGGAASSSASGAASTGSAAGSASMVTGTSVSSGVESAIVGDVGRYSEE